MFDRIQALVARGAVGIPEHGYDELVAGDISAREDTQPDERVSPHTAQAFQSPLARAGMSVMTNVPHCLRDSRLKTVHGPPDLAPIDDVPVGPPLSNRTRDALRATPIHQSHLPSVNSRLATKDQSDVSALSYQGIRLLSTPLLGGIRFFRPPVSAPPSARLTARSHRRRGYGVAKFRLARVHRLRCLLSARRPWSVMPHTEQGHPASGALWLKPFTLFGLVRLTTVTTGSRNGKHLLLSDVHPTDYLDYLTPHPDEVSRRERLSRLVPRISMTSITTADQLLKIPWA